MRAQEVIDKAMQFNVSKEACKQVKAYATRQYLLKVLTLFPFIGAVVCLFYDDRQAFWLLMLACLAIIFMYWFGKHLFKRKVVKTLDDACDPEEYCNLIYAMASYSKRKSSRFVSLWNFTRGLRYWGKLEEMNQVMSVAQEIIETPRDAFFYHCALCDYAFETKNLPMLEEFVEAIARQTSGSVNNKRYRNMYESRLLKRDFLRAEAEENYQQLYQSYTAAETTSLYVPKADRIIWSYHRGRLAKVLGSEEEGRALLQFVVNEGNKLWCVKAALSMGAAPLPGPGNE